MHGNTKLKKKGLGCWSYFFFTLYFPSRSVAIHIKCTQGVNQHNSLFCIQ